MKVFEVDTIEAYPNGSSNESLDPYVSETETYGTSDIELNIYDGVEYYLGNKGSFRFQDDAYIGDFLYENLDILSSQSDETIALRQILSGFTLFRLQDGDTHGFQRSTESLTNIIRNAILSGDVDTQQEFDSLIRVRENGQPVNIFENTFDEYDFSDIQNFSRGRLKKDIRGFDRKMKNLKTFYIKAFKESNLPDSAKYILREMVEIEKARLIALKGTYQQVRRKKSIFGSFWENSGKEILDQYELDCKRRMPVNLALTKIIQTLEPSKKLRFNRSEVLGSDSKGNLVEANGVGLKLSKNVVEKLLPPNLLRLIDREEGIDGFIPYSLFRLPEFGLRIRFTGKYLIVLTEKNGNLEPWHRYKLDRSVNPGQLQMVLANNYNYQQNRLTLEEETDYTDKEQPWYEAINKIIRATKDPNYLSNLFQNVARRSEEEVPPQTQNTATPKRTYQLRVSDLLNKETARTLGKVGKGLLKGLGKATLNKIVDEVVTRSLPKVPSDTPSIKVEETRGTKPVGIEEESSISSNGSGIDLPLRKIPTVSILQGSNGSESLEEKQLSYPDTISEAWNLIEGKVPVENLVRDVKKLFERENQNIINWAPYSRFLNFTDQAMVLTLDDKNIERFPEVLQKYKQGNSKHIIVPWDQIDNEGRIKGSDIKIQFNKYEDPQRSIPYVTIGQGKTVLINIIAHSQITSESGEKKFREMTHQRVFAG